MSGPKSNVEVPTMKRFRLRLSSLLWLVAVAAAFLGGMRYAEYRAEAQRPTSLDPFDATEMLGTHPTPSYPPAALEPVSCF
jgi:hypothetical protein